MTLRKWSTAPASARSGAAFVAGFHQARRGRCAEDYRRVLTRLMAAGVTSDRTPADVLNLSAIHNPDGTAWNDVAVRRLRRELGLGAQAAAAPPTGPRSTT